VLGLILMVAEAFAPSFGALGIGGAFAFVLGAAIFLDTDSPAFAISWPIVVGTAASALAFSLIVVRMAISSQRRQVVSGPDQMIGQVGVVQDWQGAGGHVFVHGERWHAVSVAPMASGQNARITSMEGLTLQVEPETNTKT
jgi:membrane-bound serine protease (ClpP class)